MRTNLNITPEKTRRKTSGPPRLRPPGVPRPSVLTDVHDLLDDLDWRTAVDETITARSRLQPGWDPAITQDGGLSEEGRDPTPRWGAHPARLRSRRPRGRTDHCANYDEFITELVHSAETARLAWLSAPDLTDPELHDLQKNELNDKHITPTPTPRRDKTASPGRRARTP